jgi:ribosomal protein S18 acetylase RimI-like enzyme
MFTFSHPNIAVAGTEDAIALKDLLNSAYRGESSKRGWTTEAHLIAGEQRSDEAMVLEAMLQPASIFLKFTAASGTIEGCVNLQQQGEKIYLGMFSVSPGTQGGGIGKSLLAAAEQYAKQLHCTHIHMQVITARTDLISWYIRHGYRDTGVRKPFVEDGITGKHLQPLEFMMLEKTVV